MVITCDKGLITILLKFVLGVEAPAEDDMINMIAEMANTISGNARVHFGSGFDISVPTVVVGEPEEFKFVLAEPTLVIPFTWLGHRANAIIGLT
jgi:chemotaxis protein CheX